MSRLFIGIELPAAVKDELSAVARALRPAIPSARWIPRDNLHVTIRFLGTVDDVRAAEISAAIASAVAGLVDVPVTLGGLGAFRSARSARIVWVGITDPAGGVSALASAINAALMSLGFGAEERSFQPHVTLARLDPPAYVTLSAPLEPIRFTVDRATLFESHLSPDGARYTALATFPFRRAPAPPRDV